MVASSIVQRRYFGPCLVNGPRRSRSPEHPFSHPGLHPQHTERLAACWGEMLGGPAVYSRELASVAHMVRIHSGNGPHPELDAATERCFALALNDAGIPDDERLRSTLVDWFAWSIRVVNHAYERLEQRDRRRGCHLPADAFGYAGFVTACSPRASACRSGEEALKPLKVQ